MPVRKLNGPLGGDYQTDGVGNAVPLNAYPLDEDDNVPARLADHEGRVTAAEAAIRQGTQRPLRLGAIGDSISIAVGSAWNVSCPILSGGRITMSLAPNGVGGNTTAQMLARIDAVITDPITPDVVVVLGGTNDVSSVPAATTKANLLAMYDAIAEAEIEPVAALIPPKDTSGTANIPPLNAWIAGTAANRGMRCIDFYTPFVDPDGTWKSGCSDDGTHPNAATGRQMGQIAADELLRGRNVGSVIPLLAGAVTDSSNLLTNGVFSGDTNTDGTADNWTLNNPTGGTPSIDTPGVDGIVGNWQTILVESQSTQKYFSQSLSPSPAVGDVLLLVFRLKIANFASGYKFTAMIPNVATLLYQFDGPDLEEDDGGIVAVLTTVPSGFTTGSVRLMGHATGTGSFSVAQVAVRNLTALGIV